MIALLLAIAGFSMGYVVSMEVFQRKLKKLQDNAYHAGFENGLEKGQSDLTAELRAFAQAELNEQAALAERVQDLGYSIYVEENLPSDVPTYDASVFADSVHLTDGLNYSLGPVDDMESEVSLESDSTPVKKLKKTVKTGKKKPAKKSAGKTKAKKGK